MTKKKRIRYKITCEDIKRLGLMYIIAIIVISCLLFKNETVDFINPLMLIFFFIIAFLLLLLKICFLINDNKLVKGKYNGSDIRYIDQIIDEISFEFERENRIKIIKCFSDEKFGGNAFVGKFIVLKGDWYCLNKLTKDEVEALLYQTLWHEMGHKDKEPIMVLGIFEIYTRVVKFKNWTRECRCDRYGKRALIQKGYSDKLEKIANCKWGSNGGGGLSHPLNDFRKKIYLSDEEFVKVIKDIAIEAGLEQKDKRIDDYIARLEKHNQIIGL